MPICNNAERQDSSIQDQHLTSKLDQWGNKVEWLESKDLSQEEALVETEVASVEIEVASEAEAVSEEVTVEASEEEVASVIEEAAEEGFVVAEEDIEISDHPYHLWRYTV